MKIKSHKYSFTLIELMITLAILSALSGIVVFVTKPANIIDQANDQRRITEIKAISQSIDYLNTIVLGTLSLGNASTVYLSLPDNTSTSCSSYSLPTLPTGFSYACKNATDYRKNDSTGWIPVNFRESDNSNILATLPIDPINTTSYYYSYNPGGSYEVNAFLKSAKYVNEYGSLDGGDSMNAYERGSNLVDMPLSFPHNWVKVPGNSLYGTSDFWVMQYEAKYSVTGRSSYDAPTSCKTTAPFDTIDWAKAGACATYIPTWNNQNVISSPVGSPLAGVTHTQAKTICTALGGHLITNAEWMTIARNADQQAANWTSGIVGTGYLFNGNSGDTSRGYDGADPEKGISRNPRALLVLSNGSKIYDFAGNIFEHVMKDLSDTLVSSPQPIVINDGVYKGSELTALVSYGDFVANDLKPTDPTWNSSNGMGLVYHYDGTAPASIVLLRSGDWLSSSAVGAFTLALNATASTESTFVGFRCVKN